MFSVQRLVLCSETKCWRSHCFEIPEHCNIQRQKVVALPLSTPHFWKCSAPTLPERCQQTKHEANFLCIPHPGLDGNLRCASCLYFVHVPTTRFKLGKQPFENPNARRRQQRRELRTNIFEGVPSVHHTRSRYGNYVVCKDRGVSNGPAILHDQPCFLESLRPCKLGISVVSIFNSVKIRLDLWKVALNSTLLLACDKRVFSAHVCFFPSLKSIIQMAGGVGYDFQAGGVAWLDVRYSLLSRIVRGCSWLMIL